MPQSVHVHKSMLLKGVKHEPPTLDRADIEATKGRASHSGRSFGGAPLRGGRGGSGGRGRGGNINYSDDRPNPFAQHLNPNFTPPSNGYGRGASPPSGYGPPPPRVNGYYGGPPAHQQNGHYNGPPPGYYNGAPPPSTGGYYSGPPQGPPNGYGNPPPSNYYGRGGR
jgi:5'-3' exoribonuclease 2